MKLNENNVVITSDFIEKGILSDAERLLTELLFAKPNMTTRIVHTQRDQDFTEVLDGCLDLLCSLKHNHICFKEA